MTDEVDLDAALKKLEAATRTIRASQHGRTRPLGGVDIHNAEARVDRIEDALLAIEEALKALKS
jgi:exonuclease VII small subunit